MNIQLSVIVWTVICFVLLRLILKNLLFKPVLQVIDSRREKIDAAKNTEQAATTASSGKMGQNSSDSMNSTDRNFLSGLWEK